MTQTQSIPASGQPRRNQRITASPADAASVGIVCLSKQAKVIYVNRTWQAQLEGGQLHTLSLLEPGVSFRATCEAATNAWGRELLAELDAMCSGERESFERVFSAHVPSGLRWLRVQARWQDGKDAVVLTCVDHTDYRMALARSRIQGCVAEMLTSSTKLPAACRTLGVLIASELEWDAMMVWVPDAAGSRLRCRELWTRPAIDLGDFDVAALELGVARGQGLAGRVWSSQRAEWVSAAGCPSGLAFAVGCEDEVLAVIELLGSTTQPPVSSLLALLEMAGRRLAAAEMRLRAESMSAQAQREANEAREQLETALACVQALVIAIERDGTVRFINRTAPSTKVTGTGSDTWQQYVPAAAREGIEQALRIVLAGGPAQKQEIAVPGAQGSTNWLTHYLGPVRSGARVTGALLVVQDISQMKQAQHELFEAQRMAALGTMAAGIAHEINTPVQFVGDSLEFLRDATHDTGRLVAAFQNLRSAIQHGHPRAQLDELLQLANDAEEQADLEYLQERVPRAFDRCADGLSRVTSIVRSMKEFSHPAHKEMVPADLNRAILATLTVARNEYKYVADLVTELGELPQVCCHINEINQVVLNIVVNAAHAIGDLVRGTTSKGTITVRTSLHGEHAQIAISDTGGGIPDHVRDRVFEPFFTTKEVGRGTGQGLALAWRAIKERHGGELWFDSTASSGTTFYIRLPVAGQVSAKESA